MKIAFETIWGRGWYFAGSHPLKASLTDLSPPIPPSFEGDVLEEDGSSYLVVPATDSMLSGVFVVAEIFQESVGPMNCSLVIYEKLTDAKESLTAKVGGAEPVGSGWAIARILP